MNNYIFYAAGYTPALGYCTQALSKAGYTVLSDPTPAVTHLLLPVPSFTPDGCIIGGSKVNEVLASLPKSVVVIGGNLNRPELGGYTTIDFLQNPQYLAMNANITAHCAIKLTLHYLPVILENSDALVIGWGRIGKCLAKLLKQMGAEVTVCARKESDRSMLNALGYQAIELSDVNPEKYRVIFNTVPTMLLPDCPGDALKIDLASQLGIGSKDVIWARGLPGKDTPESSGLLIANTVMSVLGKEIL